MSRRALYLARHLSTRAVLAQWVAAAKLRGVQLVVRAHPTARVERGSVLQMFAGTDRKVMVDLGPDARIESGSLVRLTGGASLYLGPSTLVRRFAILNVAGRMVMEGHNLLSWHSVVHCAENVVFEQMAGTGEGVTVVDGSHFRRHPQEHWYHNSSTSPIRIGSNAWLASHCTIGPGVTIGQATTVAAGSVVLTDMPDNALVAGAPARVIRESINDREPQQGRPIR